MSAQVFHGGDVRDGLPLAEGVNTGGSSDLRGTVIDILQSVLSYLGLIALVVIVIAGIYLVVGGASDNSRQVAIKVILYTFVGFLVILIASAFVAFVISAGTGGIE